MRRGSHGDRPIIRLGGISHHGRSQSDPSMPRVPFRYLRCPKCTTTPVITKGSTGVHRVSDPRAFLLGVVNRWCVDRHGEPPDYSTPRAGFTRDSPPHPHAHHVRSSCSRPVHPSCTCNDEPKDGLEHASEWIHTHPAGDGHGYGHTHDTHGA